MGSSIDADAAKLAGLQIDTLQKLRNGQLTFDQWERFNNLSPAEREARFSNRRITAPTLVLHKATSIGDVEGKKTRTCLTSKRWYYRDSDIDHWLPKEQPAQAAGQVGVYQLKKSEGTIFREMALAALKVSTGTRNDVLAQLLKEREMTYTLPAIETLVERQEGGEDVGLLTNGYANFAFVEDADGSVSVLRFLRYDDGWFGYVFRLDRDYRWRAEYRLLLRNSDASML